MKQAIGYVRASTGRQAREGVSLDAQREKIRQYCELHDLELVAIHADEGVSGRKASNRKALLLALEQVCAIRGVLVVFARSVIDAIRLVDQLHEAGADLVSLSESIDTTSAHGKFTFTLFAALARLESDLISERVTAALYHKRRNGEQYTAIAPYGFDHRQGRLVPNEREQLVIERMKWLRGHRHSFAEIADRLNTDRAPTKLGGPRYAATVRQVLERGGELTTTARWTVPSHACRR